MTGCLVSFFKPQASLIIITLITAVHMWNVEKLNHFYEETLIRTDNRTGRIYTVEAVISFRSPNLSQFVAEEVKTHFQKSAEPDDVMVFYVDPKVGGPSNETFNVVPMNPSVAEFWRTNVSELIYQALKEDTEGRQGGFLICPLYDKVNTTRPHAFIISVHARIRPRGARGGDMVLGISGYLPNPPKATMFEADKLAISIKNESEIQIGVTGPGFLTGTLKGNRSEDYERVEYRFFTIAMLDGVVLNNCGAEDLRLIQFKKSARRNDDSPGLLVSQKLSGCLNHPRNVVPMSAKAIYEYKNKLENPILDYLNSTNLLNKQPIPDDETPPRYVQFRHLRVPASNYSYVDATLIVVYSDKFSTRPAGFFFRCTSGPFVIVDNLYIPN